MPAGDMKLCLDNTFSRFSNKLVFFEIISDDAEDEEDPDVFGEEAREELQQIMDITLDDFKVRETQILKYVNGPQCDKTCLWGF